MPGRTASAAALKHWFGASITTVWVCRKAFGVGGRATTKGSKRAIRAVARKGAEALKSKEWSDDELDAKAARSKAPGLRPPNRWTPERAGGPQTRWHFSVRTTPKASRRNSDGHARRCEGKGWR